MDEMLWMSYLMPMLWKGAYEEWAKSAQGGFLSQQEIDASWQRWEADPEHPVDHRGPRQAKRLAIPNHTTNIENYEGISSKKKIERIGKVNKNVSDEELDSRAGAFLSGKATKSVGDFDKMAHQLLTSSAGARQSREQLQHRVATDRLVVL